MPEWAERQLLHPEERRGREGKEGERGGRDAGRSAGRSRQPRSPTSPRGRAVTPSRSLLTRGRGNRVGKRRGGRRTGRNGHGTGILISVHLVKLNCQSFSFQ